jgi:hypothetical protein
MCSGLVKIATIMFREWRKYKQNSEKTNRNLWLDLMWYAEKRISNFR